MSGASKSSTSNLFLVRMWSEENSEGKQVWVGRVQHVLSGETHYFHDWMTMVYTLNDMTQSAQAEQQIVFQTEPVEEQDPVA